MMEMTADVNVATTLPPPGLPPPPEPTVTAMARAEQKASHTAPLPDVLAPAPLLLAKKRKLEEAGFHNATYYKICTTVADLRVCFMQVYEATDFRNSDAAHEILKGSHGAIQENEA